MHAAMGCELTAHPGLNVADEPGEIRTRKGKPQTVFTPYWRAWLSDGRRDVLGAPRKLPALPSGLAKGRIPSLASLGLGGYDRAGLQALLRDGYPA